MLTRFTVVIISQHIQISIITLCLKLIQCMSITSQKRIKCSMIYFPVFQNQEKPNRISNIGRKIQEKCECHKSIY